MFNKRTIDHLIAFAEIHDGINDKEALARAIQEQYCLTKDRSVYYCSDFAIRFSRSRTNQFSNTVLSLSRLQKYDNKPFFVCVITPEKNYLYLANTTFISKVSHSSQKLEINNIKGSFNGSDIIKSLDGIANKPKNFHELYQIHQGLSFEDNLERIVEATHNISARYQSFIPTDSQLQILLDAPHRAAEFNKSEHYADLRDNLISRTNRVHSEIVIASLIDNVNLRGRIIEYLILLDQTSLKDQIITSLRDGSPVPELFTPHGLGDYVTSYNDFDVQTDIKTKVLFLDSNPKAYNIDKLLAFLSCDRSVYMVFLIGIDHDGRLSTQLFSIFQKQVIKGTRSYFHWAGRATRGITQFHGHMLTEALSSSDNSIDIDYANDFLRRLIS